MGAARAAARRRRPVTKPAGRSSGARAVRRIIVRTYYEILESCWRKRTEDARATLDWRASLVRRRRAAAGAAAFVTSSI